MNRIGFLQAVTLTKIKHAMMKTVFDLATSSDLHLIIGSCFEKISHLTIQRITSKMVTI